MVFVTMWVMYDVAQHVLLMAMALVAMQHLRSDECISDICLLVNNRIQIHKFRDFAS